MCSYSPSHCEQLEDNGQGAFIFKSSVIRRLLAALFNKLWLTWAELCHYLPQHSPQLSCIIFNSLYYNLFPVNLSRESFPFYLCFCSLFSCIVGVCIVGCSVDLTNTWVNKLVNIKYEMKLKRLLRFWVWELGKWLGGWQITYILLESIQFEMQLEIQAERNASPESFVLCPLWIGCIMK